MEELSIIVVSMTHASVKDLIDKWPTRSALASDLFSITGDPLDVARVHKWAQAGSIPSGFQAHVIRAAQARGIAISPEEMLRLHAVPASLSPNEGQAA